MAFKLEADPTFHGIVKIPRAGGSPVGVALVFKHRTKDELDAWLSSRKGASDVDSFMDMVQGWVSDKDEAKSLQVEPFEVDFTEVNVRLLLQNRIGVARETFQVYIDELTGQREKN